MKHHHRAMVDGKSPEAALELVAIDDRAQALARRRLVGRQEAEVRRPVAGPAGLGVAGAHEEPVRPGVKARRVAELGKVPPDREQRLLRRVLGEIGVAQDPVRHRVESVAGGDGEAREGLFVAALRPPDQLGIHVPHPPGRPVGPGAHRVWACVQSRRDSIFGSSGGSADQPTWTSRTIRRYWLFDPTQVWRVMLGRLWPAQAHEAAVVGSVTLHQITAVLVDRPARRPRTRPSCPSGAGRGRRRRGAA